MGWYLNMGIGHGAYGMNMGVIGHGNGKLSCFVLLCLLFLVWIPCLVDLKGHRKGSVGEREREREHEKKLRRKRVVRCGERGMGEVWHTCASSFFLVFFLLLIIICILV